MSVALKAVALAWRFPQTVKWLASFQGTGELRLAGTLETGKSQLPGTLETGESRLHGTLETVEFLDFHQLSIWNERNETKEIFDE